MSEPTTLDEALAAIRELQAEQKKSGAKALLKKAGRGVLAALTSPEAIKEEKSILALVLTRLSLTLPATALFIDLILKAVGGPSVTP